MTKFKKNCDEISSYCYYSYLCKIKITPNEKKKKTASLSDRKKQSDSPGDDIGTLCHCVSDRIYIFVQHNNSVVFIRRERQVHLYGILYYFFNYLFDFKQNNDVLHVKKTGEIHLAGFHTLVIDGNYSNRIITLIYIIENHEYSRVLQCSYHRQKHFGHFYCTGISVYRHRLEFRAS